MSSGETKGKKLWGGRFSETSSDVTERLSASIHYDRRLYKQDIEGSIAHAGMLRRIGILSEKELSDITNGLREIEAEINAGVFTFSRQMEDIHMNIEARLTEKIGDAGKKLHTGRSRNDQIALDMRLYLRDEIRIIHDYLLGLVSVLTDLAENHLDVVMPGYTHMQVAMPVRFSQHMMAWVWMLLRDLQRLENAGNASSLMPLGAGALAGVNYPSDREFVKQQLGFEDITPNSMDTVADRDFVLDFLYFASVLGAHLSRMCEELVLWSTSEFAFIRLSDRVTTGSSIMPQKRNPDLAELIRGKSGRLYGNLVSLLTVVKGLPMTYNRDMQEDKEPLFDSVDTVKISLEGMIEMLSTIEVRADSMKRSLYRNFSTATDLADYLARKGVPFRESHEIVGRIVGHCEMTGADFFTLDPDALRKFSTAFSDDIREVLNPATSTERKESPGSTARREIEKQIATVRMRLGRS